MKKIVFVLSMGLLLLNGCSKEETNNNGGETLKTVKLTFEKLIVNNATITITDLLAHIKEKEKDGFAIKNLSSNATDILSIAGKAPNYQLTIKKYGQVTLTMVLYKKGYKEVTLKAVLVIKQPNLTFRKLVTAKSNITSQEMLSHIDNSAGYKVKGITLKDTSFGSVTGTTPNLKITLTKYGNFTADLVLSKTGHLDANIKDAPFEFTKDSSPNDLKFKKLSITNKNKVTAQELIDNIQGTKAGYQLKAVSFVDSSYGTVTGSKPDFVLNLKKPGDFTVNLTLEHKNKKDVSMSAAIQLTLTKLIFSKYIHTVSGGKTIKGAKLMNNIWGATGYHLRKIVLNDTNFGTVSGTDITLKKAGSFNATLTLSKVGSNDEVLPAEIEVVLPNLTFTELAIGYKSQITKEEIIAQIKGNKTDYDIKQITLDSAALVYANTTKSQGLYIKKAGAFTASILLANPHYFDVLIKNAQFQFHKNTAPNDLKFNKIKLRDEFKINALQILGNITGDKMGYKIKTVKLSDDSYATVTGTKPNFVLNLKKAGDFTINLTLEHDTKKDVSISADIQLTVTKLVFSKYIHTISRGKTIKGDHLMNNILGGSGFSLKKITLKNDDFGTVSGTDINLKKAGLFQATLTISKAGTDKNLDAQIEVVLPHLTFSKLTTTYKGVLNKTLILNHVAGNKTGYVLKEVVLGTSPQPVATINATTGDIQLKKIGAFTASIVLTNPNYFDVSIANAQFEITKATYSKVLNFNKLKRGFITGGDNDITSVQLLKQIDGAQEGGFKLKSITLNDGSFATVGGTKPNLKITPKKTGNFTAKIVLEHPTFLDLSITDATFEILSDSTEVKSWKFAGQAATINGTHITVQYPFGTPVNALKATVEISKGASIKPDPEINTDYTNPVNFTVTAEDENTTRKYTLTVTFGDPNISYTGGWRDKNAYTARIDHKAGKITLEVNSADFELDFKLDGATITPDPNTISDWTNEVSFTVQKRSSKKTYGMRVTVDGKNIIKVGDANIKNTMTTEIGKHGNTANYNYIDVSEVTDMTSLFAGYGDIAVDGRRNSFDGDISKWDVSKVTKMQQMFEKSRFNQPIGDWDVSKVKNMRAMFNNNHLFGRDISKWDVSNVINMQQMFRKAVSFDRPIGNWTVSSVANMNGMFYGASFNQSIVNWDTSSVTDMSYMFYEADEFNQPIGNWIVSEVKDMSYMFSDAHKFNQPIGNWIVSEVEDMSYMFYGAHKFNQPIGNWTVSEVEDMSHMFFRAYQFNQPIGDWTVSNVENMQGMFHGATKFNQPIGNWTVSSVKNMQSMFNGATKFNQPIGSWTVSSVENMRYMFYDAIKFNQNIKDWDVDQVTKCTDFSKDATNFDPANKPTGFTCSQ